MVSKISAAKAKARFSSLVAEVAHGGKHFIIERRGKPVAALVSIDDLQRLEEGQVIATAPGGALAMVGAWQDAGDDLLDTLIAEIYARRQEDKGRPVEIES